MIKFLDIQHITRSFQPALDEAVHRVVASGWYLHGAETQAFETAFATYCRATHCIGVANGLDALYLALAARRAMEGWDEGDEVIVPAMTFVATAEAVLRAGLRPVLVDVGRDALIDVAHLDAALSPRTRAVVPVHLYGQMADMSAIRSWASRHSLFLLEDAAQAHGGEKTTSAMDPLADPHAPHALEAPHDDATGRTAAFSFYPGKNLGALGDGGALVTDDDALADRVRAMANYGASRKYYHEYEGCNSRLDELQAAVLRVKLARLDSDNARRQQIAHQYYTGLCNDHIHLLPREAHESVWHIFPVFTAERDALRRHLEAEGVQTLIHYPLAIHQQPCMAGKVRSATPLCQAEYIAAHELSIPISPIMSDDDVQTVLHALNTYQP